MILARSCISGALLCIGCHKQSFWLGISVNPTEGRVDKSEVKLKLIKRQHRHHYSRRRGCVVYREVDNVLSGCVHFQAS